MGQVDSAEAHLRKLMSFLLERSQRICSRVLASSNLQHRKSRRVECEEAKPAGAQELVARARSSRRNPSLLRLSGRGRRTCWIMQTALGEHMGTCWIMQTARGKDARGARAITATILAIVAQAIITTVARLEATEFERMYEEINKKVRRSLDPLLASRVSSLVGRCTM